MAETQLGMFDAAIAEQHQRTQKEADMLTLAHKSFSPKDFLEWKTEHDEMNAFFARPRKPLRPDLQAALDTMRAKG